MKNAMGHIERQTSIRIKRRRNSNGVLVYRATVKKGGEIYEMHEAPDKRFVRRWLRQLGYKFYS